MPFMGSLAICTEAVGHCLVDGLDEEAASAQELTELPLGYERVVHDPGRGVPGARVVDEPTVPGGGAGNPGPTLLPLMELGDPVGLLEPGLAVWVGRR
jgi:hypothetical protein